MFNYTQRWQITLVSQKIADRPPPTHTCHNTLKTRSPNQRLPR
ncbi:hypothetical protein [Microcoleus sp. AR_TQ3_B6]